MLNSYKLKAYLIEFGFEHFKDNVRIDGFSHPNLDFPVYLKTKENKKLEPSEEAPVVFHSIYEEEIKQFVLKNKRVTTCKAFYFFNSNMSGFEKKLNKGKDEIEFGIHLNIADKQALTELINTVSRSETVNLNGKLKDTDNSSNSNVDERILQSIKTRRGQPVFRKALLAAFKGTCCISGCNVEAVLEAAHIVPHGEVTNFSVMNGLLLRADIHTLFDLGLLDISVTGLVQLDKSLKESDYQKYEGLEIMNGELPVQMIENLRERINNNNIY